MKIFWVLCHKHSCGPVEHLHFRTRHVAFENAPGPGDIGGLDWIGLEEDVNLLLTEVK